MMLVHLNLPEHAHRIQNALFRTIEDGIHTADMKSEHTKHVVGTQAFAQAIIERLGQEPSHLVAVKPTNHALRLFEPKRRKVTKQLVGVDVFLDWDQDDRNPDILGRMLDELAGDALQLKMITNRGVKVYPYGRPETFCTDHWRCRFVAADSLLDEEHVNMLEAKGVAYTTALDLLERLTNAQLNFIKIENLYLIDGERAYSLGQGE